MTCLGEMAGPRLASRASSYHSEPDKGQHASSVLEMMQKVLCGVPYLLYSSFIYGTFYMNQVYEKCRNHPWTKTCDALKLQPTDGF
jgi:hypothetical protein